MSARRHDGATDKPAAWGALGGQWLAARCALRGPASRSLHATVCSL